jgi:hypothetical protein
MSRILRFNSGTKFLYDFASRLARRLIKKLPGWDKAPWGIDFPEQIAVRFT